MTEKCPACGSREVRLHEERGELVCQTCGLVLEESLPASDPGPLHMRNDLLERRTPTRADRADRGLTSRIGLGKWDGNGQILPARNRQQVHRLKRAEGLAHTSFERGLGTAFRRIHSLADILELDRAVVDTACVLYRRWATPKGHGRQVRTYAAAALYAACRQRGIHRPRADFAAFCTYGDKGLRHAYWNIIHVTGTAIAPHAPANFLAEMAQQLGSGPETLGQALHLATAIQEARLCSTCRPQSVAAACLFLETLRDQPELMQATVARKCGVSENTLHKVCVEVVNHLVAQGLKLPPLPPKLAETARLARTGEGGPPKSRS